MHHEEFLNRLPHFSRRWVLKVGAVGLGFGTTSLVARRATADESNAVAPFPPSSKPPRSVLFIFLTGGLSHHDSFDMKPEAPTEIRGEFQPIATRTPGLQVCEYLPELAKRSEQYALLRSMHTASNQHAKACHMILTGRLDFPPGFSVNKAPSQNEWPSMPTVVTYALRNQKQKMPLAAVLPQPNINENNQFRPGQYAGRLGKQWEAWHIDIAAGCPLGNGACPECFRFDGSNFQHGAQRVFETPTLQLPTGSYPRLDGRLSLLDDFQTSQLASVGSVSALDTVREQAISVLADEQVRKAFGVETEDSATVERYGANKFGLSVLMGKRLIESGVRFVQVNLGKNSSWDTHQRNFPSLKNNLLPPFDRCISALLDDMSASGLLDETLVIVGGEFGRTPKINKNGGRDHWGPVNTMLFAGGGISGGTIHGASDHIGGEPTDFIQTPEDLAATIYDTLGIPQNATWRDFEGRPHEIYHGQKIKELFA